MYKAGNKDRGDPFANSAHLHDDALKRLRALVTLSCRGPKPHMKRECRNVQKASPKAKKNVGVSCSKKN